MDSRKEFEYHSTFNFSSSTPNKPSFTNISTEMQDKFKLLMEGFYETNAENAALNKEILKLLNKIDLNQKVFSMKTKDLLQKMLILKKEGLTDFEEIAIKMCAINRKADEKKHEREEKRLKHLYEEVFKNYQCLHEKSYKLDEAVFRLNYDVQNEYDNAESESSNQIILRNRLEEYEKNKEKLEKDLENMEADKLHPDNLLNKSKLNLEKIGELVEFNNYLQHFAGLPPNLLQAKAVLESKKLEYEKVNQMLREKI